ncbi:MAG: MAPEG family protein [Rhodanobacteraceae bacterium]
MRITGLYAALAALLILVLAVRVSLGRRSHRIGLGEGGNEMLARRIRVHGNAVEYVPLALILLLVLELNQTQPLLLHVFGCVLIAARIIHAFGLSAASGVSPGRAIGSALTWLDIAVMALLILWQKIGTWVLAQSV